MYQKTGHFLPLFEALFLSRWFYRVTLAQFWCIRYYKMRRSLKVVMKLTEANWLNVRVAMVKKP